MPSPITIPAAALSVNAAIGQACGQAWDRRHRAVDLCQKWTKKRGTTPLRFSLQEFK
jgi:hypothetical protein